MFRYQIDCYGVVDCFMKNRLTSHTDGNKVIENIPYGANRLSHVQLLTFMYL
jgi:hypothetical protein